MSCSPFDLRDYFLGELNARDRAAVEEHASACAACRHELAALNMTRSALLSVADEEPARRIAFVSDKVFEPTWWQKMWRSGPRLGFASAAMLSAAILTHAFVPRPMAPQPVSAPTAVAATATTPAIDKIVAAEVERRLAESEDRQAAKLLDVVNARLSRTEREQRATLLTVHELLERNQKGQMMMRKALYDGAVQ